MATGLQVQGTFTLISGGYVNELYGSGRAYQNWTDVDTSGEAVSTYYYRDSDSSNNYQSTQVVVTIRDRWSATLQPDNSYQITIESYLTSIVRNDKKGYAGQVGRSIRIKQNATDNAWLREWLNTPVNTPQTIFSGNLRIGTKTHTLYPGQSSSTGSIYYRNNVSGHDGDTPPNIYIDEFYMGLNYRNNLPSKLNAPVLTSIEQSPEICQYLVDATFHLTMDDIPDSNAHTIRLQISTDSSFSAPDEYTATAIKSGDGIAYFTIPNVKLKPATGYYCRTQLVPDTYVSDWRGSNFTTIQVITPPVVAPEFSEDNCEQLTSNLLVAEWPRWEDS